MKSPFFTHPLLVTRSPHMAHLYLLNDPQVSEYRIWGHQTVIDAYGDPTGSGVGGSGSTQMFSVVRGGGFRSHRLRSSGRGLIVGSTKNQTHMAFDLDDYASTTIPPDDHWLFLRVQEFRNTAFLNLAGDPADPVLGPVYCLPPASVFGALTSAFTCQAIAPSDTGCVAGAVPLFDQDLTSAAPRPLYMVFPLRVCSLTIRNISANELLVSFGAEQAMVSVGPDTDLSLNLTGASARFVVLACPDAGGAAFTMHGVMAMGG